MTEQRHGGVDVGEVDLGERLVHELDVVPVPVPSLNLAAQDDLYVLGLAVAQVETRGVAGLIRTVRAPSSRRPSPPEGRARVRHPSVR